jgi:hypothetical protein
MRLIWFVCILFLFDGGRSHAQAPGSVYEARSTIAQSRTLAGLRKAHDKFGFHDKLTELAFFSRWLAISPGSTAAARGLLQTVPATEKEALELMALADPPEEVSASNTAMSVLGNIHDHWPQLVARAALRFPESMKSYVAFLPLVTIDMHSNFTGNAQQVCKKFPKQFRSAVAALPKEDREYVRGRVFDPDHCRAIFVSEAE